MQEWDASLEILNVGESSFQFKVKWKKMKKICSFEEDEREKETMNHIR